MTTLPADEAERATQVRLALYDALDLASGAVLAASVGQTAKAVRVHQDACVAALAAFPEGSAVAEAFNTVLDYVGGMAREVTS